MCMKIVDLKGFLSKSLQILQFPQKSYISMEIGPAGCEKTNQNVSHVVGSEFETDSLGKYLRVIDDNNKSLLKGKMVNQQLQTACRAD